MNEIIIQALADRIKAGMMEVEQVPEVYRQDVNNKIEEVNVNV